MQLDKNVTEALGNAWNEGRVKIAEWLEISPAHLLSISGVVASVHHGGANTYFETSRSVLPFVSQLSRFQVIQTATQY